LIPWLEQIFEVALSGLTWDYIKEQLLPYLELLFKNKS